MDDINHKKFLPTFMTEKVQLPIEITLIRPSKIKEKVMTYDACLSVEK